MKLKCLFVFLTVCLMVSAVSAAPASITSYWDGSTSNWDDDDGTSNWVNESNISCDEPDGTTEVKLGAKCGFGTPRNTVGGQVTLNSEEAWGYVYSNRMRVMGNTTLNVVDNGLPFGEGGTALLGAGWLRVGEFSETGASTVNQTGGVVRLKSGGRDPTRLTIGDSQDAGVTIFGLYKISGGTLTHHVGATTSSEGSIIIGDRNGTGTFQVIGTAPKINMGHLYMGGMASATARGGTGTLQFDLIAAGVAMVNVVDSNLDTSGAISTSKLVVNLTEALTNPGNDIVLVSNSGATAVKRTFEYVNGIAGGAEWTEMHLGGNVYYLTYLFDAGTMTRGTGNDIALIPEPATIALLSLGLLTIRRKK